MTRNAAFSLCLCSFVLLLTVSTRVVAQDPPPITPVEGATVVWNSTTKTASKAYIDASVFFFDSTTSGYLDICKTINGILTGSYPQSGAVVDARGIVIPPVGNTTPPLTCSINPFGGVSVPSTILLPGATIVIQKPWILPSNTRLIGQSKDATTIELDPTFGTNADSTNAIIEMGSASVCTNSICTGISIEHLRITAQDSAGNYQAYHGVYNDFAQDSSYVKDVALYQIGAASNNSLAVLSCATPVTNSQTQTQVVTGLCIGPNATYSGPYSDINFTASAWNTSCNSTCGSQHTSACTCQQTACAQVQAQTRGLHGFTCTSASNTSSGVVQSGTPQAAIYLDSYNNTINDVHVEGFYDGIVVGDNPTLEGTSNPLGYKVQGNTISNITVSFGRGPVQNAVHICNPGASSQSQACQPESNSSVSDVSIANVLAQGTGGFAPSTVQDDLTGTGVGSSLPPSVYIGYTGMYILGELLSGTTPSYSRFTTSPGPNVFSSSTGVPTWIAGAKGSTSISGTSCTVPGAVYSNTTGSSGNVIYVCSNGTWQDIG